MENVGKFFMTIIFLIISTIVSGFVFMKLWAWFISGTFDILQLNIIQAIGLSFVVSFLTIKIPKQEEEDDWFGKMIYTFVYSLAYSGLALLLGWLLSLFM